VKDYRMPRDDEVCAFCGDAPAYVVFVKGGGDLPSCGFHQSQMQDVESEMREEEEVFGWT